MFALAVITTIAFVVVAIVAVYLGWRGYKTMNELLPFILSICVFPILLLLAYIIMHTNLK